MRDTLFIRLLTPPTTAHTVADYPVEWCVRQESRCSTVRRASLLEASVEAANRIVIVLAPSETVLVTEVTLPPRASKLEQIVPFLLEDQVADDISQLHFAYNRQAIRTSETSGNRSKTLPVATIQKHHMQRWQTLFQEAGIRVDSITAATHCLPNNRNELSIVVDGNAAWLQTELPQVAGNQLTTTQAIFCERELLPALLPGVVETLTATTTNPAEIRLYYTAATPNPEQLEAMLTAELNATSNDDLLSEPESGIDNSASTSTQIAVNLHHTAFPDALSIFAAHYTGGVNLLQGEFAAQRGHQRYKAWAMAASIALILGILATGIKIIEVNQLAARDALLSSEITRTFRTALPNITRIQNARVQMEQALAQNTPAEDVDTELLTLIESVAAELNQNDNILVQQMAWRNDNLELELQLPDVQLAEQLKTQIEANTTRTVQITSVNAVGSNYKVKLRI